MSKLLITGAFGLVGSNICKVLERDYPDVEITKYKCAERLPVENTFDYIIHAAGYGQPQMFSKDKLLTLYINGTYTDTLFEGLKKGGKFLFISSSEIYSGAPSPHKETDIGTTTPQHPRACYIEGKRCGEAICMAYKEMGYDVKIARLALAYGPGTKKHDTRVLNEFIEQSITKGSIEVKSLGLELRTYCYVDDAVTQILNILFKGKDIVYNVGGNQTIHLSELASKICSNVSFKPNLADYAAPAPQEVKNDMTKTITEFPMEFTSLDEGLLKTIEYQKTLYV